MISDAQVVSGSVLAHREIADYLASRGASKTSALALHSYPRCRLIEQIVLQISVAFTVDVHPRKIRASCKTKRAMNQSCGCVPKCVSLGSGSTEIRLMFALS